MGNKVLLIDDDPEILNFTKEVLEPSGYEVGVCDNGRDAMKTILAYKPDLLILDVMLPGMDGYTLATQLTEDAATRDMPIIMLSGLGPARAMFSQFPQVAAFIDKPFNPPDLLEMVRKALIKK